MNLLVLGWVKRAARRHDSQGFGYDAVMTRRERISTMFARRALTSPDAPLEHYVNGLEWGLPRALELSADHLAWDAHRDEERVARPGPGLLQDFVKLADAPDGAILKYAARCGPLWLCDCGLPWQVNSPFYQCQVADVPGRPGWHSEWLSDWRDIARDAGAVLRIAHKLRNRQLAEQADWELVRGKGTRLSGFGVMVPVREGPWEDDDWADYMKESRERARRGRHEPARPRGGATLEEQHRSFWNVMDGWVLRGGVRPFFEWGADDRAKPSIRLGGDSLSGATAVQPIFDLARTDGLA